MAGLLSGIRHEFRSIRSSAAFTVAAVLTLAVGIGANSAIFGVVLSRTLTERHWPGQDAVGEAGT